MSTYATNGYGVAFAADNHTMQDKDWQYRSDKPKLTVAPNQTPSHLQVFDLSGGTQWSMVHGDLKEEIPFKIKHGFTFKPMFLCYFYVSDAPAAFNGNISQYLLNYGLMRYNGDTWFEELYAYVDETYFYIKHHAAYNGGTDVGAQTSYGSQYQFRVRLEIIARKAVTAGSPSF